MSLSTARSFLSEVYYDEQELDANSALMELDKGQSHQPIVAAPGDDVLLPCPLQYKPGTHSYTLEWTKIISPQNRSIVYLYRHSNEVPITDLLYIGRTKMFPEGLKEGNCSLLIRNVTSAHQGLYRFFIPKLRSTPNSAVLELVVDTTHHKTTVTPQHVQNLQTSDPPRDTGAKGHNYHLGFVFVPFFVILLFGIGYIRKKREKKRTVRLLVV
ncbi:uncharacterized protein LOC115438513 isoform X1 [Sphaeramia orbicularis]|uniref:uncharacterized protein LOC115438513 isoform X1 n=1 Tax=Sphaeramia orbicularis TaxID=375764 RepID=UPI00117F0E4F|nr:uncharacterized protein LOC115438513 isoform X1 [Sphaeramia orbicularis]